MAWTLIRPDASTRLNRIPNWEARGLSYWKGRVLTCNRRIGAAYSSTQLGRALADREVALEAMQRLAKQIKEQL